MKLTSHLSPHDRLVLDYLQLLEQASSGQLQRLCFSQPELSPRSYGVRTRGKLLSLHKQGYMRRFPSLGTGGWVYLPGDGKATRIDHHVLDVTELYIRLAEAERLGMCQILEWLVRERITGKYADDAYLWIQTLAGKSDWHVEADRGSENKGQVKEKMGAYIKAYHQSHGNFPAVLYVVTFAPRQTLEQRRDDIRRWAKETSEPALFDAVTIDEFLIRLLEA